MHLIRTTQSKEKMLQKPWLAYSIQAMKPVEREKNQWAAEKTTELESQLRAAFTLQGLDVEFYLIGSVAVNTQLEEPKNIDLLAVLKINNTPEDSGLILGLLRRMYQTTLSIFPPQIPEVMSNDSLPQSLKLSFPSWGIEFCLYFSIWQQGKINTSGISSSSGEMKFLIPHNGDLVEMDPFQGILKLNLKDQKANQNVKPLIRILKKLKQDSTTEIPLSGHEITSIVYSMDDEAFDKQEGQLLFLLLECSLYLKKLEDHLYLRRSLRSPDKKPIMGLTDEKRMLTGIKLLKIELDKLIKHLVLEIDLYTNVNEVVSN